MFYISSQGHSGTGWLAKSLNKHPSVICWHGTRSIPPYNVGEIDRYGDPIKELSPVEFIDGLLQCEKKSFGNKVFGSIHGYHGILCKEIVEKNGGKFFAVFRHPILKINSIFSAFYATFLSGNKIPADKIKIDHFNILLKLSKNVDFIYEKKMNLKVKKKKLKKISKSLFLYKILKNIYSKSKSLTNLTVKKININDFDIKNFSNEFLAEKAIETFEHSCIRTFETDYELIKNCHYDQFLKMEGFVKSKDYFKECFIKITEKTLSNEILDNIFNDENHVNIHSNVKSIEQIYSYWPKSFKNVYKKYINDLNLEKTYKQLGYNLLLNG